MDNEVLELKAQAYDCIALIEQAQLRLRQINERLRQLQEQVTKTDTTNGS